MRILVRTRWLLPILVIGLAVLVVKLPISASHQVLADGPLATDGPQAQIEGDQLLASPLLAESVAEGPDSPDATVQFDEGTQGTY